MRRYLIFLTIGSLFNFTVYSQNQYSIKELSEIYEVVDTVKPKFNHYFLKVLWMGDTIEIRKIKDTVKYDLHSMRKAFRDSTYNPTNEDIQQSIEFAKNGAQNCFSYAFERYFGFIGLKPEDMFNQDTHIGKKGVQLIFDRTFVKTQEFSTKKKRKAFKKPEKDGTLIVFRNKYDWIIHAFYYEKDIFYSKNGIWPIQEYDKMRNIFKRYFDTALIQYYEIDNEKVNEFVGGEFKAN